MLDKFAFARYYTALVLRVAFRLHKTNHPLGIGWRWRLWRSYNGRPPGSNV